MSTSQRVHGDLSSISKKQETNAYNKEYPALRSKLSGCYKGLDTGEIIPTSGRSQNIENKKEDNKRRTKSNKEKELNKINEEMRKLSLRRN